MIINVLDTWQVMDSKKRNVNSCHGHLVSNGLQNAE